MIQLVYWGLAEYALDVPQARGAAAGLVAQSRALLLQGWREHHYVFENYGGDDGEGFAYSSSSTPLYHWGALSGFIGLQHGGFYTYFNATAGAPAVQQA